MSPIFIICFLFLNYITSICYGINQKLLEDLELDVSSAEAKCIKSKIDYGNSTLGALALRGFPLLGDFATPLNQDQGRGQLSTAFLDLEPIFEVNWDLFREFLQTPEGANVWREEPRRLYSGSGCLDLTLCGGSISGWAYKKQMIWGPSSVLEQFYETRHGYLGICEKNAACRAMKAFGAQAGSFEVYWVKNIGPLNFKGVVESFPYWANDMGKGGITLSASYREALDELPSSFEEAAYVEFVKRFGVGYMTFAMLTSQVLEIGEKQFLELGSANYLESDGCTDPVPANVWYSNSVTGGWGINLWDETQKAKLDKILEVDNLVKLMYSITSSPTNAPTNDPTSSPTPPTGAPTNMPSSSTDAPSSASAAKTSYALLSVAILFGTWLSVQL